MLIDAVDDEGIAVGVAEVSDLTAIPVNFRSTHVLVLHNGPAGLLRRLADDSPSTLGAWAETAHGANLAGEDALDTAARLLTETIGRPVTCHLLNTLVLPDGPVRNFATLVLAKADAVLSALPARALDDGAELEFHSVFGLTRELERDPARYSRTLAAFHPLVVDFCQNAIGHWRLFWRDAWRDYEATDDTPWDWTVRGDYAPLAEVGRLTMMRGVALEDVVRANGADPHTALTMTAAEAVDLVEHAALGTTMLRTGQSGDWCFTIETGLVDFTASPRGIAPAETLTLSSVEIKGLASLDFVRDGRWVAGFDLGGGGRIGQEPTFFDDGLARVGLPGPGERLMTESEYAALPNYHQRIVRVLTMLTDVLGVSFTRQIAEGPLLTAFVARSA